VSIERARRYYLLKRLAAKQRLDDVMALTWQAKQEGEPGSSLSATFPYRSRLVSAGYSTTEDLLGATTEELQQVGFTARESAAVLAAI
jgi:hypothetical protein